MSWDKPEMMSFGFRFSVNLHGHSIAKTFVYKSYAINVPGHFVVDITHSSFQHDFSPRLQFQSTDVTHGYHFVYGLRFCVKIVIVIVIDLILTGGWVALPCVNAHT